MFVLTSHYLYYYETEDIGDRRAGTWVEPIRRITLLGAAVSPVKRKRSQCAFAFRLDTPADEHASAYKLGSASSPIEADEWTRTLQLTIDALNGHLGVGKVALTYEAEMPNFLRNVMQHWPDDPIKQGWLFKQGHIHRNWKKRWFILVKDALYYFHSKEIGDPRAGNFTQPIVKINLSYASISTFPLKQHPYAFLLETPHDEHASKYIMDGGNDVRSKAWMDAIRGVMHGIYASSINLEKSKQSNVKKDDFFQLSLTTGVNLAGLRNSAVAG